jgi:hypothetical protein
MSGQTKQDNSDSSQICYDFTKLTNVDADSKSDKQKDIAITVQIQPIIEEIDDIVSEGETLNEHFNSVERDKGLDANKNDLTLDISSVLEAEKDKQNKVKETETETNTIDDN